MELLLCVLVHFAVDFLFVLFLDVMCWRMFLVWLCVRRDSFPLQVLVDVRCTLEMTWFLVCCSSLFSRQSMASDGGFGSGGLMFQLDCGHDEDTDNDYDVDPDLLTVSTHAHTLSLVRSLPFRR